MLMEQKLFKVVKMSHHEMGLSTTVWTKYFFASKKETVEEILRSRYGKLSKWYDYDRTEEEITVTEVECEVL